MTKASTASEVRQFEDIPNIGPAMAADFRVLGIGEPGELAGHDPYGLYDELCERTGMRHDSPPQAAPTAERKAARQEP
jgi:hypothetical protein